MFKHFFRLALRNLVRNKTYSFINIGGLAVGLAGFIIVLVYLNHELSYDKWSPELSRVYRVSQQTDIEVLEQTPAPLAQFLKTNVPGISVATTVQADGDYEVPLTANEKTIYSKGSVTADSLFLRVFPFHVVSGDPSNVLNRPDAIVISRELGQRLFGNADPMGKPIKIYGAYTCQVTGIFEQPTGPSHLYAEFIWRSPYERQNNHWGNQSFQTYVKLDAPIPVKTLESRINPVFYNERLKEANKNFGQFRKEGHQAGLFVDAVASIHNFPVHGSSQFPTVMVLLVLAFLLLIAGAVNFSNLTIAASIRRAKEVGIRKTMGSGKGQLLGQFLGETAMQCVISLLIALVLVALLLPWFSRSFNVDFSLFNSGNGWSIAWQIALCLLLIELLSGLYPALFLAMLNTTKVLKGEYSAGTKGRRFRNALIVVQFVVAAFFVFGSVVINRQVHYMQTRDKGFSGEQVMRIEAMQKSRDAAFDLTKQMLSAVPGVAMVAKTTEVPGDAFGDTSTFRFKLEDGNFARLGSVKISDGYFTTLGIALVKGRLFDERYADQHTRTVILNETAAATIFHGDAIDHMISFDGCDTLPVRVVGVVKDFLVGGFEQAVQPVAYTIGNDACMFQSGGAILVKMRGDKLTGTIAAVQDVWKKIEPDLPLRYSFLDDNFAELFASYNRLQQIIGIFTIVAIVISLIGLFAITAYLTGQRSKEIGVRKVLGAGVGNLAALLSRDFVILVGIAIAIAAPLAWWATRQWLNTFAYRIPLNGWLFVFSAAALLVVALTTIVVQTSRAAMANPIRSLRSE